MTDHLEIDLPQIQTQIEWPLTIQLHWWNQAYRQNIFLSEQPLIIVDGEFKHSMEKRILRALEKRYTGHQIWLLPNQPCHEPGWVIRTDGTLVFLTHLVKSQVVPMINMLEFYIEKD